MNTKIKDYALRFYVRDLYIKNAAQRGGEVFRPPYKKDLKPFENKIRCAVNMSKKVIEKTAYKFPITLN